MSNYFDRDFYRSAEWKAARAARLVLDNHTCTKCGATERLEVHHVISIGKGGAPTAMFNLRTECKDACHKKEHRHLYNAMGKFKPTRIKRRSMF